MQVSVCREISKDYVFPRTGHCNVEIQPIHYFEMQRLTLSQLLHHKRRFRQFSGDCASETKSLRTVWSLRVHYKEAQISRTVRDQYNAMYHVYTYIIVWQNHVLPAISMCVTMLISIMHSSSWLLVESDISLTLSF